MKTCRKLTPYQTEGVVVGSTESGGQWTQSGLLLFGEEEKGSLPVVPCVR